MAQTDFDFSNVSTGYPTEWSQERGEPFMPVIRAYMQEWVDPRYIRLYDTVSITLLFNDEPIMAAHVVGAGENLTTTFYHLARQLDALSPDINCFSKDNMIGVQTTPGHTLSIAKVAVTPYRWPPVPSILVPAPLLSPPKAKSVNLTIARDGQPPKTYSAVPAGTVGDDLQALATEINKEFWLAAEADLQFLKIATHATHEIVALGGILYG